MAPLFSLSRNCRFTLVVDCTAETQMSASGPIGEWSAALLFTAKRSIRSIAFIRWVI